MIALPPLTPDLLGQLGKELGGCDFAGANQQAFLSSVDSCDVQAAPGHGKTTLLVAKLALLSRCWDSRAQGVCVISHTNAARVEVEKKLAHHPAASAFLGYPHFIGTVTAFLDRYIALPYLRGLGWSVHRIDDEVFAAAAGSRWRSKQALVAYARMNHGANQRALEHEFVPKLALAQAFVCDVGVALQRLAIRHRHRQPGPNSASGAALEELKAELINDGYYRFCDLTALAVQAIEKCPALLDRVRQRFPLVLLDEAQDTNGEQLALLAKLFGTGVAYQRLGDQNQTLYEDEDLTPNDYWRAGEGVIPLNESRRFGTDIASFASRLTVRAQQQITGLRDVPSRRTLILFCPDTIGAVLPAYVAEVRCHWGDAFSTNLDIRAVASRHNPTTDNTGEWPKTLVDYCPGYSSGRGRQSRPDTLCAPLRQAALLYQAHAIPAAIAELFTTGIAGLLRRQGWRNALGQAADSRNLWRVLAEHEDGLAIKVRRMLRDCIALGDAAWSADRWNAFRDELTGMLGIHGTLTDAATTYLEFVAAGAADHDGAAAQPSKTLFEHDGVTVRLGSIHSVKGKTVDGLLVVETEVWRGHALVDRAMDLATVLPHAFGLENRDFNTNIAQLAAATNIFVAATRPRQLLACAVRKAAVTNDLAEAARAQGWQVCDLTAAPAVGQPAPEDDGS
jgi:DNA helicase-2/ATP-dependent DNA helicase PcrA